MFSAILGDLVGNELIGIEARKALADEHVAHSWVERRGEGRTWTISRLTLARNWK